MQIPSRVKIVEVGPRDGFQMEERFIPTELKVAVINRIARAGVSKIEATSFVSPKTIPQMRDAAAVMASIERRPGVVYTALVPNAKGAELATAAKVDAVRVVVCATESYNIRNVRMTVAQSLETCRAVMAVALGVGIAAEAIIALAFGCPLEGEVPEERVVTLAGHLVDMGYQDISIADSVGVASPVHVRRLMRRLVDQFTGHRFSLHLHNTRGLGLANVLAALEGGIDTFDSSIGGLGGCPTVPGGSGNISTEDLVNMVHEIGSDTAVDLDRLLAASEMVQEFLQRPLASYILSAGTRQQLYRTGNNRN